MPTFNLVDEPWIRCVPRDGGAPRALNLRDALGEAHRLREIVDDSPLVVVALHRLLLAILHRVHAGPATVAHWRTIRDRGEFDRSRLDLYLTTWRHRFDLFDPERPFYQTPQMPGVNTVSVAKLAHEKASGNNITLFDHTIPETGALTPAQAARYLIAFQAFAIGGGVSQPFNLSDAPLARDYTVLVRGRTLFETLLLNLVRYDSERPIGWLTSDDAPWWEQSNMRTPAQNGTPPDGYLDYLTWQSRRIHLIADEASGLIRECQIRQQYKLSMDARDPFKAYVDSKDKGVFSRRLSEQRAIWRDSHALLDAAQSSSFRPAIFDWLAEALASGIGRQRSQTAQCDFDVLGFLNDGAQATVILWRHDHLPLPLNYLTTLELRNRLYEGLRHAEEVALLFTPTFAKGKALNSQNPNGSKGVKSYPRPLYRLAEELLRGIGLSSITTERDVKPELVREMVKRFDAERIYWAALEPRFRHFMVTLAERMEVAGADGSMDTLLEWSRQVEACAKATLQTTLSGLEMRARTARARALAERDFTWQLRDLVTSFRTPLEDTSTPERPSERVSERPSAMEVHVRTRQEADR